jgi:crotonobetainyl-CoA:carnitine CoA-transferase CaiB-like acyl-CoA transferase
LQPGSQRATLNEISGGNFMAGVLEGLRVLDLSWGLAGPKATMLLADHGADVVRVERPGGEPFERPLGYRVWQRGKRSAALDLKAAEDLETFRQLASAADILVESFAPGTTEKLGIDYASLSPANARLVYCSITPYGRDNAHSDRPGYDALVAARTGLQWEARGWNGTPMDRILGLDLEEADSFVPESVRIGANRDGPIFPATEAPSVLAAYLAVLGISSALRAREKTGRGQWVETSLLQAVIQSSCASWQRPEHIDAPGYTFGVADRRQTWGIVRAKDGFMCTWASPPEWFEAVGAGDELKLPEQDTVNRAGGMQSVEERLRALERIAPIFAKFTTAEWSRIAAESGAVSCQPVRTPEAALLDPALLAEGAVAVVEDPELGPLHQAGLIYRLHANPPAIRGPAPRTGEHTAAIRAEAASLPPSDSAKGASAEATLARGPLDGIRIVDFGLAVAGPWCTQLLADLGADVVKVDPLRQSFWMPSHMAIGVNRSKRCMGLDVKTPEGNAIARKLIEGADVVVHNMRPQAAEKLGLDFATLREINPRVVFCHTRGFEDGPRSLLPGNDQTGNALGGTLWEDGGCWNGGRPWFGATSNGDIGNGFLAAIAVVQALLAREKSGVGQAVDASILNAALFNNSRVYTTPEGEHFERPTLDSEQLGLSALYRLYECAEGWLCLAVVKEEHWAALSEVVSGLAADARFRSAADRRENDGELARVLGEMLRKETAKRWFERLDAAGVPCEISSDLFSRELFDDGELMGRGWTVRCEGNAVLGTIDMFGTGIDFSDTPSRPGGPPATMWQHTGEILAELGYSPEEIEALYDSGAAIRPSAG